ncbi:MAG: serine hydrolase domain-containing protein, partial [Aquihabitans sp.]
MTEIQGHCDEKFSALRDQFAANFEQGLELGASLCVTKDGETVVDLWGGDADTNGRPWERDTICNVWSTTKTMAATVMLMLADRGEIDLDAPVCTYWPEFKAKGKESILVRHVMAHTAGLPGWNPAIEPTDLYDQDLLARNFEAQEPWWEPGTKSGYHLLSQGHLEAEIVRRVTGTTLGTFFRDEVAGPLGAEFFIGLPESEEPKVAELIPPPPGTIAELEGFDHDSLGFRAAISCPVTGAEPNTRAWRAAEIPAAGGQGNARGVARVHAALANGGSLDGVKLMAPATVERIFEEQI